MKIASTRAEAFAAKPDSKALAILFYGPDSGAVRERATRTAATVAPDLTDAFRVVELDSATLKRDPARLADEVAAVAFGGGRRVVRIRDAGDAATDAIASLLEHAPADVSELALVVLEAGELGPRSPLRRLFEDAANAASVPCYQDEGAQLANFVRQVLREDGIGITADALEYLGENLGSDRALTRSELGKLAFYVGRGGKATLEDAMLCVGDSSVLSLDNLVFAAGAEQPRSVDRALDRVLREGVDPVTVVRAVTRHFERLHLAAGHVAAGQSADAALGALRPPVFFKNKTAFLAQMRRWPPARAERLLDRLLALESQCKTTGVPADTVCRQELLLLSAGF